VFFKWEFSVHESNGSLEDSPVVLSPPPAPGQAGSWDLPKGALLPNGMYSLSFLAGIPYAEHQDCPVAFS